MPLCMWHGITFNFVFPCSQIIIIFSCVHWTFVKLLFHSLANFFSWVLFIHKLWELFKYTSCKSCVRHMNCKYLLLGYGLPFVVCLLGFGRWTLSCSMWDPVPWPGTEPGPCIGSTGTSATGPPGKSYLLLPLSPTS